MFPDVNELVAVVPPSVALHPTTTYEPFFVNVGAVIEHEPAPLYALQEALVALAVQAFVSLTVNVADLDIYVIE